MIGSNTGGCILGGCQWSVCWPWSWLRRCLLFYKGIIYPWHYLNLTCMFYARLYASDLKIKMLPPKNVIEKNTCRIRFDEVWTVMDEKPDLSVKRLASVHYHEKRRKKGFLKLSFSHWDMSGSFATPWTVAGQAPLSVGFLEWVAISFSRGSSRPRDGPVSPALAGGFFTTEPPRKPT